MSPFDTPARARQQHQHSWDPFSTLWPSISVIQEYVRIGGGITQIEVAHSSEMDEDYCTNPDCSFPNGVAPNETFRLGWSDGEVGGKFGHLVEGSFVESANPDMVTHYKAPMDVTKAGVITIYLMIQDIPFAEDPATGQIIQTTDDDGGIGFARLTAWDFTISNGAAGWRPRRDEERQFTATIVPASDHRSPPNSMARHITFWLARPLIEDPWGCSREPGYCLNATRVTGAWTDTTANDNDLKFHPNEPNGPNEDFVVSSQDANLPLNYDQAVTVNQVLTETVTVRCLDYGAYGRIVAVADFPNDIMAAARRVDTLPPNEKYEAQIPIDENPQNYIYDGSPFNNRAAAWDEENDPHSISRLTGVDTPGDGFSQYEEYRSIVYDGGWNENLFDRDRKDVFVYIPNIYNNPNPPNNPSYLDIAVFRTLGLQIHDAIRTNEFDFVAYANRDDDNDGRTDGDPLDGVNNDAAFGDMLTDEDPPNNINPDFTFCSGAVNWSGRTAHNTTQGVIVVTYHPNTGIYLGITSGTLAGGSYCSIGIRTIRMNTNPNDFNTNPQNADRIIDPRDPAVIRMVIGHEMGHSINMPDHSGATTRQCVRYLDPNAANFDPTPQGYCANNPGCQTRWWLR
jgi:hypothetical protein